MSTERQGFNMKNILDKLYYGKINPFERNGTDNKEYKKLTEDYLKAEKQLKEQFGESHLLENLQQSQDKLTEFYRKESYIEGLKFGIMFMIELFSHKDNL